MQIYIEIGKNLFGAIALLGLSWIVVSIWGILKEG